MIKVIVGENESIERAITRFKKKCQQAGVLRDYRKNSYFLKPSQRKRLKHEKAVRRQMKFIERV
ncbi:MAG: 30S ribosomal protein S21 [candidate division KSB1 bacterium]|jgi:small subunit ribosomal protein S21|nr:30S ribosomal protein S21 [candidate division KSB1 bacterium]MDZ7317605.1 30S ribosomal protein S21 [candidate division KSB1 bacterium]MDZ7340298.1 30S ribosomal protein S21 [candidate division KSB1 bacterium]